MRSDSPALGPSDSVREILSRFPQAGAVFERHGLLGCGGQTGPDERLDLFAAVHRVSLDGLLAALEEAIRSPSAPAAGAETSAAEAQAATLYRRFLRMALVCTLTLGATFGAANLLVIQLSLGTLPPEHNWVHATFQLFGFVLPFVMGVAYHALPRFLGTPLRPLGAAKASFWLVLAGLLVRSYGQFGSLLPWTAAALFAGGGLQLVALACFAWALVSTFHVAPRPFEPFHGYLAAGLAWWLVAGVLLVAEGGLALWTKDSSGGQILHEPLYLAVLFGAVLAFIDGFILRMGGSFLGLPPPHRGGVRAAWWLGQAGAALCVAGAGFPERRSGSVALDLGLFAIGGSIAIFAASTSLLRARAGHAGGGDPSFATIIRQAVVWELVAAALAALYGALDLAEAPVPGLLFDGLRHSFALGFVTLMIFGMAGRIVPIFGGVSLRWPALRTAGAWLISTGVLMRELEVVASVGAPWLLHVSACSGLVAATGVALASASLLKTIGASAENGQQKASPRRPLAIQADANVHDLVTAYPEALAVLIHAGFTQLASPLARQTLARAVSLRQACGMHGIDVDALVSRLRESCGLERLRRAASSEAPSTEPLVDPAGVPVEPKTSPALAASGRPLEGTLLLDVLHHVVDPELGIDIVDLGLVYGVDVLPPGRVRVRMTLTSPNCPSGVAIQARVEQILRGLEGVEDVDVSVTFDPPWSPERMSPEAREELGFA